MHPLLTNGSLGASEEMPTVSGGSLTLQFLTQGSHRAILKN